MIVCHIGVSVNGKWTSFSLINILIDIFFVTLIDMNIIIIDFPFKKYHYHLPEESSFINCFFFGKF
ncbi:hypothetical protein OUZ56_026356 [Daphnia magna]|uniref:Uncharacterized protein n=1 Tax=Daphnia magna TaxID=35525 RepID=A0ABQ9ZLN2_9CRUS|nr:hypothetical protein OUZ56_026356 [Daphnia magna]